MVNVLKTNVQPGEKKDDYWEPGKGLLADPQKFLDSLFKFDKDNISDAVIKSIQPYIDNEAFQPAAIAKVSNYCSLIKKNSKNRYKENNKLNKVVWG